MTRTDARKLKVGQSRVFYNGVCYLVTNRWETPPYADKKMCATYLGLEGIKHAVDCKLCSVRLPTT
jgi:hypothetical protein